MRSEYSAAIPHIPCLPSQVLLQGSSAGEAALLRPGPRLCSATAEVDSTVVEIARRDIALLQRSKPQACLKLMMGVVDLIGDRMRDNHDEMRAFLNWKLGG